jgi:hypothetical protein
MVLLAEIIMSSKNISVDSLLHYLHCSLASPLESVMRLRMATMDFLR